ncbi:MAG: IS200/IS605 family transposase [Phycisphaerae bacterium]
MSSFYSTRVHFIWSTARRAPTIHSEWQDRLHGYLHGILVNKKSHVFAIGGMADHVHLYASLPATVSLAELVNALKTNSSVWVHENALPSFAWQSGYAAVTMSKSADEQVCRYIKNQARHHHTRTFQEEFMAFLEKFEIPYDPRYVFD